MLGPGLTKNYIMGSVVPLSKIPHRGVSLHMFVELIKRGLFFVLPSLVTRKGSEDVYAPFSYSRRLQLPFPFLLEDIHYPLILLTIWRLAFSGP